MGKKEFLSSRGLRAGWVTEHCMRVFLIGPRADPQAFGYLALRGNSGEAAKNHARPGFGPGGRDKFP